MTDSKGYINQLRYQAKQYTSGTMARGGGGGKHWLDKVADRLENQDKQIAKLEGSNNGLDIACDHWEKAAKKLQAVVDSHLDWIKIAGGIKCPQCDDSGGLAVDDGRGGCELEQCQFCYECTDSKFNIQLAAKHATHATPETIE